MKELQNLPPGKLLSANTHGYTQFRVSTKIDGKYKRKSITRQKNLIRSLARAEFLRKEIDNIEQIINLLRMAIDQMHDIDPNTIIASMTRAYRTLPLDYFFNEDQFIIDHHDLIHAWSLLSLGSASRLYSPFSFLAGKRKES